MFKISYDTWKEICDMYFAIKQGSKRAFLQWFPFTKLGNNDKNNIASKEFYEKYVQTGAYILFQQNMYQSKHYLKKVDGSFRSSYLISPFIYLILQCIGKEIYNRYFDSRPDDISVYYAGNYGKKRVSYKNDYDNFYKEINSCIDQYQYFIKTDISNFFSNINLNILINQIDEGCNNSNKFSQILLYQYKEFLCYCGDGQFPLIENSVSTSYLSTIIYLANIDKKIYDYILNKFTQVAKFKIIRYVDDMYILISFNDNVVGKNNIYNEILSEYSSQLKEYGLTLNAKKTCFKESKKISDELKKSLYDEEVNLAKHNIEEQYSGKLLEFLTSILQNLSERALVIEKYNSLIEKHFYLEDIEFIPNEVFNYYIYENENELLSKDVIELIERIVDTDVSFINLDVKCLTTMVLKTKSEKAIKSLLNYLFNKSKENKWNAYNTSMAIAYLIQRGFKHKDLLNIIKKENKKLYDYYNQNCKESFLNIFNDEDVNSLIYLISNDEIAYYLYFMYLIEMKKKNYMVAYAYFKTYFDRITADFEYQITNSTGKKPNYKKFYKENLLINFYENIEGSELIIKKAHKKRNANPLCHSSAELITNNYASLDLVGCINELESLIFSYITVNKNIIGQPCK